MKYPKGTTLSSTWNLITLTLLLVSLAACAPTSQVARSTSIEVLEEQNWQLIEAEKVYQKRQAHLQELAWKLRTQSLKLCPDHQSRSIGIDFKDTTTIKPADKEVYSRVYGSHLGIVVTHVVPGSPAHISGLQKGDIILSVNGKDIPEKKAAKVFVETYADVAKFDSSMDVQLRIQRSNEQLGLEIEPVTTCMFPAILLKDDRLNAFADGAAVYITTGMYRFAETDEELLTVLAHEFAHNSEGHIQKKTGNFLLGSVLDIIAAGYGVNTQGTFGKMTASLYSQDFEREADYVGMYYLANSGVDTSIVKNFWRRMAIEHPDGIQEHYDRSHPSTAERWVNLSAAHEEIQRKLLNESELLPERK